VRARIALLGGYGRAELKHVAQWKMTVGAGFPMLLDADRMQFVSLPEANKIETRIAALWEQEVVIVNARCTRKYSTLLTTSTWFTQEVEHQGPFWFELTDGP
jgi:hypothetical protein